jgi:hypothetical protein
MVTQFGQLRLNNILSIEHELIKAAADLAGTRHRLLEG